MLVVLLILTQGVSVSAGFKTGGGVSSGGGFTKGGGISDWGFRISVVQLQENDDKPYFDYAARNNAKKFYETGKGFYQDPKGYLYGSEKRYGSAIVLKKRNTSVSNNLGGRTKILTKSRCGSLLGLSETDMDTICGYIQGADIDFRTSVKVLNEKFNEQLKKVGKDIIAERFLKEVRDESTFKIGEKPDYLFVFEPVIVVNNQGYVNGKPVGKEEPYRFITWLTASKDRNPAGGFTNDFWNYILGYDNSSTGTRNLCAGLHLIYPEICPDSDDGTEGECNIWSYIKEKKWQSERGSEYYGYGVYGAGIPRDPETEPYAESNVIFKVNGVSGGQGATKYHSSVSTYKKSKNPNKVGVLEIKSDGTYEAEVSLSGRRDPVKSMVHYFKSESEWKAFAKNNNLVMLEKGYITLEGSLPSVADIKNKIGGKNLGSIKVNYKKTSVGTNGVSAGKQYTIDTSSFGPNGFGGKAGIAGYTKRVGTEITDKPKDIQIIQNMRRAMSSTGQASEKSKDFTKNYVGVNIREGEPSFDKSLRLIFKPEKGAKDKASQLAVSVAVLKPKETVTSYVITSSGTQSESYDIADTSKTLKLPGGARDKYGYAILRIGDKEKGKRYLGKIGSVKNLEEFKEKVREVIPSSEVEKVGLEVGGVRCTLGTREVNGGVSGYVVIAKKFSSTPPPPKEESHKVYDFELGGLAAYLQDKPTGLTGATCYYEYATEPVNACEYAGDKSSEWKKSTQVQIQNNPKTSGAVQKHGYDYLFHNAQVGVSGKWFYKPTSGKHTESSPTGIKFNWGMYMPRYLYKDVKTVSSLYPTTSGVRTNVDVKYQTGESTKGYKPRVKRGVSEVRSSSAEVGTGSDTFEWSVWFKDHNRGKTSNTTNYLPTHSYWKCPGHRRCSGSGKNRVCWTEYHSTQYHKKWVSGGLGPVEDGTNKVTYKVGQKAEKYKTAPLTTSQNPKNAEKQSLYVQTTSRKGTRAKSKDWKLYDKFLGVNYWGCNNPLYLYPEVMMRAYEYDRTKTMDIKELSLKDKKEWRTGAEKGGIKAVSVPVMGEEKRTVYNGMMGTARVVHDTSQPAVKGKVMSRSVAINSGLKAEKKEGNVVPHIYAGGELSIKVEPQMQIHYKGYVLDMIQVGDSGYRNVVSDGTDVYREWGNNVGDKDKAMKRFKEYTIEHRNNLDASITLMMEQVKSNGAKRYFEHRNMNVRLGKCKIQDYRPEGFYPLLVKKGEIVKDSNYNALMRKIANDNGVSVTVAEKWFKESELNESIQRAVEDSKDSFNKSQKVEGLLPGEKHWYDEQVRTVGIRCFSARIAKMNPMVAFDKVEYKYEAKPGERITGWFYWDLYYNKEFKGTKAKTKLVDDIYVYGSHFKVPAKNTSDMLRY